MGFPELYPDLELSITLVSDEEIRDLAARYGRPPRVTDVLAFAMREGPGPLGGLLGDVVVSVETAERQARRRRTPLDRELRDLVIHGTLHLLGMDHLRPAERADMRALERQLRWTLEQLEA